MKCLYSIRWRLQLWHGGLLVLVLAGFGLTAWQYQRHDQLNRIDHELEQRMGLIAGALRPGNQPPAPLPELRLSQREASFFEGNPGQAFYYIVWLKDGQLGVRSALAPSDAPLPPAFHGPPAFRSRGIFQECFQTTQSGNRILVGREIRAELTAIRRFGWMLTGAGSAVLALGLLGGWWISSRALRPIGVISATATRIATGDLSQRIPTEEAESELGQLAHTLNHTFARLQASFARQVQFTADASHELRTPVAVVLTQTQTALARERSANEYRESLAACQRAAQRMRGLIEALLTLARLDAAEGPPPFVPCELDIITREAVELLRPLAQERDIVLKLELSPAPCMGNPEQLAQVITNLATNAIYYNQPGGDVRVKVAAENAHAVLSVSDTGMGIAPDDIPHLFERFYRSDKARSATQGHTGLGLAITKAIIESHCGKITVESAPGEGSIFKVYLGG
jgi:heavy metal sensor kinase